MTPRRAAFLTPALLTPLPGTRPRASGAAPAGRPMPADGRTDGGGEGRVGTSVPPVAADGAVYLELRPRGEKAAVPRS